MSPLGLAEAFIALLADGLAIETLLHIVAQMMRVVELRLDFEEPLQLVHHIDGIEAQLFPVDDVQLLRRIVGQPVFQMLGILAGIQATVAQILQRAWRGIACSDDLRGEREKERGRGRLDRWQEHVLSLGVVPATCHMQIEKWCGQVVFLQLTLDLGVREAGGRGMRHVANEIEKLFLWGAK